jgi:hypothetical protein
MHCRAKQSPSFWAMQDIWIVADLRVRYVLAAIRLHVCIGVLHRSDVSCLGRLFVTRE